MVFSLATYDRLLDSVTASGRAMIGVARVLMLPGDPGGTLVLRHDVDRMPARALRLAARERARNLSTSYYFRANAAGHFPESAIRAIADMGHEVGYHYENLSRCGGCLPEALDSFRRDLEAFRKIAPCTTICMHGAPLSRHDNMALLEHLDLPALALSGDAFRDMALLNPVYLSDTGGRWNADRRTNHRDRIAGLDTKPLDPRNEAAFCDFLRGTSRLVYINVHPERWPASSLGVIQAVTTDAAVNLLKQTLRRGRAQ